MDRQAGRAGGGDGEADGPAGPAGAGLKDRFAGHFETFGAQPGDKALAVEIFAMDAPVGVDADGVDGADQAALLADLVAQRHDRHFVRNGDR